MHKLRYMALGGLLMFIGMLSASVFMPNLVAQRDKFGEIECTKLKVVDADGVSRVVLTVDTKDLVANRLDKSGVIVFGHDILGGGITAFGMNGERQADLRSEWGPFQKATNEHGGRVVVWGNDGRTTVELGARKQGGIISIGGGTGRGAVDIGINEHGNGAVSIWDKNGYRNDVQN